MRRVVVLIAIVVAVVADPAWGDNLYVTDFESFNLGTIDQQQGWTVGIGDYPLDGEIVNDGTGNKVLQVTVTNTPGGGWGDEVKRNYDAQSTKQYLTVEFDFNVVDATYAFWFMDNNGPDGDPTTEDIEGGPESIFWGEDWDYNPADVCMSNAQPGLPLSAYVIGTWYHVGIEVDQESKEILRFNFDGTWMDDDDTPDEMKWMNRFIFRCYTPTPGTRLWIDNLSITDGDGCGPGDVDCNGVVDGLDLTAVLTAWETEPGDPLWNESADLDDNNIVDGLDLTEVISNWTVALSSPDESEAAKPGKRLGNVRKGR